LRTVNGWEMSVALRPTALAMPPAGVVAGRHRREDGVVEGTVAYVGFGGQQELGLGAWVVDVPELGRGPIPQGVHDEVQSRTAVQR
jgi:hypothetical protein